MRIITIQLNGDEDNRDADDLDDSDEVIEQALREEENRRKHFMAQEKLERAESNGRRNTWTKGLRWALGSGARMGPGEVSCGRRVGQGWRGVRIGGGSGRRSRRAWQVRTPRAVWVCRRR